MSYYDNYWDEDFYNEPSEFEQQVYELKDAIAKSVKDEFIEKMEKLEKENIELQKIKKDFDKIEDDYKQKERDLKYERSQLESTIRRERLSKLMKDNKVEMYGIGYESIEQPKCDKCDKDRRIWYKTPSGRKEYEKCSCAKNIHQFKPILAILYELSFGNSANDAHAWYKIKPTTCGDDEYLSYESDSISKNKVVTSEDEFKDKSYWSVLFKDKELAQKFCDYTNKNQKE